LTRGACTDKRHHDLKSVQDAAAPVTLKTPFRIEALFACQFIALLTNCLIEREPRQAMTRDEIRELPLYHEHAPAPPPPPHASSTTSPTSTVTT